MKASNLSCATLLLTAALLLSYESHAQLKDVLKGRQGRDSTTGKSGGLLQEAVRSVGGGSQQGSLSAADVANGLKEALEKGTVESTKRLSAVDGFLGNAAVRILMPPEARKVEETLRGVGLGRQVDQAITSMNRAAEDAAKSAAPIFVNAIKGITIGDAFSILRGPDTAATSFLRQQTVSPLTEAFRPVIEKSLEKVNATRHWNTVFTNYNRVSREPVNTDLTAYVTERALAGIFLQIAQEEANIRRNPAARTSDLLRRVFGSR